MIRHGSEYKPPNVNVKSTDSGAWSSPDAADGAAARGGAAT
jgi:hypothetical protein